MQFDSDGRNLQTAFCKCYTNKSSFPRCKYGLPAPAMLSIKIAHKYLRLKKCAPRQKHYKSLDKLCGKPFSILLTLDRFHAVNGLPLNMQKEQLSRSRPGKHNKVQEKKTPKTPQKTQKEVPGVRGFWKCPGGLRI